MANQIIKTHVIGGLVPYQMFEFYSTFGLRDPSIWEISLKKMLTEYQNRYKRKKRCR